MKISRNWLSDYIDLRSLPDDELSRTLTSIGHAVEAVEAHGDDSVFEIEFTTNRIDAMSHLGLARELSAALDRELRSREMQPLQPLPQGSAVTVRIDDSSVCSRYSAVVIRGVTVRESDQQIAERLEATGHRSINNVVDATNYVMLSIGHPLHAFDLQHIENNAIRIRRGSAGESIVTLDGQTRKIDDSTAVIADGSGRAIALGGVMGGENSEVTATTRDIVLECAVFDPSVIRRTARRLGLKSDASYRFERGVDPADTLIALRECADLIVRQAGGTIEEVIDVIAIAEPRSTVLLRRDRLREATGGAISSDSATAILRRLGMRVSEERDGLEIEIPSWRRDLGEPMDLVEELLRLYGYDRIEPALPQIPTGDVRHDAVAAMEERLRSLLVAAGLTEVVTYGFVHPSWNEWAAPGETAAPLVNALNENISSMRLSMVPGLLQVAQHNRAYGTRDGAIFESGRTYHRDGNGIEERRRVGFLLFGNRPAGWGDARSSYTYFDAKGIIERIAQSMNIDVSATAHSGAWLHQGATLSSSGRMIARIGLVERTLLQRFELKGDVVAGEIDVRALVELQQQRTMRPISKFPGVPMVLAMYHAPHLTYGEIVAAIRSFDLPDLQDVGLWDRFHQTGSPDVKTAIGLWYQADDRSLTQEEVAAVHRELSERIVKTLDVRLITT